MLFPLLCGDFVFDLEPWIPRESIDVYQQSISTENQPPMNNIQKTIKKEQPCQINNLPQTCEDLNESKKPRINLNLGRWKWTQAYDDIVYGIRAKLFVLKINFKSNFGHLKGLVSRKFNRIFHKREPFTFNNYYPRYPRSEIDSSLSRDTRLNIDYDKGFWARLGDCKSIKNQRCKIMYRLEKYMREKKQLSNRQLRHNLTADWLSNQVIDLGPDCKIERQSQNNLGKTFENNSQLRNCCYKSQSHTRKGPQVSLERYRAYSRLYLLLVLLLEIGLLMIG